MPKLGGVLLVFCRHVGYRDRLIAVIGIIHSCKELTMFGIDWDNLQVYHYLALGGGVLTVLALILYFLVPSGGKVSAGVVSTVAALVTGLGLRVVVMAGSG